MKLRISNFRGIEHEVIYFEHINVVLASNGKGKTSILHALKFCLTGNGDVADIRHGKKEAVTSLEFSNGDVFERKFIRSAKGTKEAYINGKKSQALVAEKFLQKKFGCSMQTLQSLLSEDLLADNVGQMLYNILPVTCSRQKFYDFMEEWGLGKKAEDVVAKILDEKEIEMIDFSVIDLLYKEVYARRRELNALLKGAIERSKFDEAKIKDLAPVSVLQDKRNALLKEQGAEAEFLKREQAYQKTLAQREKALKDLETLKASLKEYRHVTKPEASFPVKLKEEQEKFQSVLTAYTNNKAVLKKNQEMLLDVFKNLQSSACPIHASIRCTTDKKPFAKAIEAQIEENEKSIQDAEDFIARCKEQVDKRNQMLENYNKSLLLYEKKVSLKEQIKGFVVPELPEKPVRKNTGTDYSAEIAGLEKEIGLWSEYELAKKAEEEVKKYTEEVNLFQLLVEAFSAKGIKAMILNRVLDSLKVESNHLAKRLHENLELEFVIEEKGLNVLARFDEEFIPIRNLSSGEQVIVLYLIMELIHKITNASIMAIDNLDRLDISNIKRLFELLENHTSFKYLVFGAVDHKDTVDYLAGRPVQTIEL